MPTYTFSTGVPSIVPAVYAAGTTAPDLNAAHTATDSAGVLSLTLAVGDYYTKWKWEGDTHTTGGEVAVPAGVQSLGELSTGGSGPSVPLIGIVDDDPPYAYYGGWVVMANPDGGDPPPGDETTAWIYSNATELSVAVIDAAPGQSRSFRDVFIAVYSVAPPTAAPAAWPDDVIPLASPHQAAIDDLAVRVAALEGGP